MSNVERVLRINKITNMKSQFALSLFCAIFILIVIHSCNSLQTGQVEGKFVVSVDTNCVIIIDGVSYGQFKNGDVRKIDLSLGQHIVIAKNADSSVVLLKQTFEVKDTINMVLDLKIAKSSASSPFMKEGSQDIANAQSKLDNHSNNDLASGSFTDTRDGKTYKIIKIGSQVWMAKNLAYKAGKDCWAYNNDESNAEKYGYIYTWETAKKVCPPGWHLPDNSEWNTLINYLGGRDVAGKKMKSTTGWIDGGNGNNSSGFNAFPGGFYDQSSRKFLVMGGNGDWWSSTSEESFSIGCSSDGISNNIVNAPWSYCVRCIKN